jgi:dTDP-glucose 4,6-dehydratase
LAGTRVALLGGTGFVGSWLTQALVTANFRWNLEIDITLFTRNQSRAIERFRYLGHDAINFQGIDFKDQVARGREQFDFFINGATPAIAATGLGDDDLVRKSTINSSQFVIETARYFQNCPKVLNLSSGAVYGKYFSNPKTGHNNIEIAESAYAKAKIESEKILMEAQTKNLINLSNARLFAFLGPGLALDQHFAVGNFMKKVLLRERITLTGNPQTVRTYLYPTDLIINLIELLVLPDSINCDIGGTKELKMWQIAQKFAEVGSVNSELMGNPDQLISIYSPLNVNRQVNFLMSEKVEFESGIRRWLNWLQSS